MRRLLAVLVLGAAVVACSDQATSPQAKATAFAPASNFGNAPPETGIVVRSDFADVLIWEVPSAGLMVVMGADARRFCELWDGGAGDPSPSFVSTMTYADKVLFDRILTVGQDREVATQVWAYGVEDLVGFCTHVLGGAAPLATGVTRGLQFFSDLGGSGNGADVSHWSYHGFLTRPDSSRAVFSFQMHWRQGVPTKVTASLK